MSAKNLRKLSKYIPLWLRNIPDYPLYRKGNPQIRVCLPLFWMRMVKPKSKLPPNQVCFDVHHQMTKHDVKNYLEKIYKVEVLSVSTAFVPGKKRKDSVKGGVLQPHPDGRRAYVTLRNETFEFPDFFKDEKSQSAKQMKDYENYKKDAKIDLKQNWSTKDLPQWFR